MQPWLRRVVCLVAAGAAALAVVPAARGRGLLAALVKGDAAALEASDVARRFGLERAFEVAVDLGPEADVLSPGVRDALAGFERTLRQRGLQVVGPSALLQAHAGEAEPFLPRGAALRRRLDALGWFFAADVGRHVRLLAGGADAPSVRAAVRDGAALLRAAVPRPARVQLAVRPLWPEPAWRWPALLWPLGLAGVGAAAFFIARRGGRPRRLPLLVLTGALLSVPAALLFPRLEVRFGERGLAPLAFVAVRGDLEDPMVMRELQRLTEHLRSQPGVADAWSVSDLFAARSADGPRIPGRREALRAALVAAANDPAVALELAPDHREALVALRFEDGSIVHPHLVLERLQRYLVDDLRQVWTVVDLSDPGLDPTTRLLAKGILASDMAERVVAVCRAHGKRLDPQQRSAVLRVARELMVVGRADLPGLRGELETELRRFLGEPAVARTLPPRGAHTLQKLVELLVRLRPDAGGDEVIELLADSHAIVDEDSLRAPADTLAARVAELKRRHATNLGAQTMLQVLDLPPAGPLSEDVRAAVVDGVGPQAAIPGAAPGRGVDVAAQMVGARVQEAHLSQRLQRAVSWGAPAIVVLAALLLVLAHGVRGLAMLFVALAPAGSATLILVLLGEPLALGGAAQLAGALVGGTWLALAPVADDAAVAEPLPTEDDG